MIEPPDYKENLTKDKAINLYVQVENEFWDLRKKYSGFFSRFKKTLSEEDNKTLVNLVGVLLPLGLQQVVQQRQSDIVTPETVGDLTNKILLYASQFKNSGVTALQGSIF